MPYRHFADLLFETMRRKTSQVVVGLDPRLDRLPAALRPAREAASPAAAADAIVAFNRAVLDAVQEHAAAVKCQVAFYERFGCEGMRAYAETLRAAREAGLIVIADVKRSDIASTAVAYADAHLGPLQESPFAADDFLADAVTVNPYLGGDGVGPFVEAAAAHGRGVFALVKTSNPSSVEIQDVDCGGAPLYERVAELVEDWGEAFRGRGGYSALGAVVGATFPDELARLRSLMPNAPLLVPGFGAQGGGLEEVAGAFDVEGEGAIVSSSRGIIYAWECAPYAEQYGEDRWQEAVAAAAADMRQQLWGATHCR
ncbi:MAG: orotidine-5'-phosphate decarboxylase [Planctomycetota bacterium]|jgi:orotidine-5'-phosphate decarboxylase